MSLHGCAHVAPVLVHGMYMWVCQEPETLIINLFSIFCLQCLCGSKPGNSGTLKRNLSKTLSQPRWCQKRVADLEIHNKISPKVCGNNNTPTNSKTIYPGAKISNLHLVQKFICHSALLVPIPPVCELKVVEMRG